MSIPTLADLCTLIADSEHKTAPKDPEGLHPLIRTSDLGNARIDFTGAHRVNSETYAAWTRRGQPQTGDLVLAREAPVGGIGRVPDGVHPVLGQRTVLLRPGPEVSDRFLMYRLAAPDLQARMSEMATGSTVPHLNMSDIRAFEVPDLPTRGEQERRAAVLAAFDELVAINERRIELLDDLARSLYREWFERRNVDSTHDAEWSSRKLFDAADVGFGFSFKSAGFGAAGSHAVVRIRDVPSGTTATFTDESAPERYAVRDGDVLIGMDGDFHLNRWSGGDAWLNQRVARLRPAPGLSGLHLMLAVSSPIRHLNQTITGTTVAHLGKRHLELLELPLPADDVLSHLTASFDAIGGMLLVLRKQVRALAATRDLLLPRLVTGQLDISDVDLGALTPAEAA